MALEIDWRPEVGKKVEDFFNDSAYKEYVESAVAFNRKLNEERKMRLPYIDGQTGVAQRHYNSQRQQRERMPGAKPGQIYTYPQKAWKKRRYQYLRYFLAPKHMEQAGDLSGICQNENSSGPGGLPIGVHNEDSNASSGNVKDDLSKGEWSYYDDMFPEGNEDPFGSDSDYEYEDSYSKKRRGGSTKKSSKTKPGPKGGSSSSKRRSQLDTSHDIDKPYSCDRSQGSRSSSRRSNAPAPNYREDAMLAAHFNPHHHAPMHEEPVAPQPPPPVMRPPPMQHHPMPSSGPTAPTGPPKKIIGPDGKARAPSLGYCDFCLGDAMMNKKTNEPEELVSCAECGRSGHPTCLQFTDNMLVSVRKYPWQCIECKCCTLCGTSENDDQLLFCDDCDRGYHMYCLVPPIKEPPEGSWSCKLCIETFHT